MKEWIRVTRSLAAIAAQETTQANSPGIAVTVPGLLHVALLGQVVGEGLDMVCFCFLAQTTSQQYPGAHYTLHLSDCGPEFQDSGAITVIEHAM